MILEQWFSTLLMLQPFKIVSHVVTSNHNIIFTMYFNLIKSFPPLKLLGDF